MTTLLAQTPLGGRDVTHGALRLAETRPGPITWIAPFPGNGVALSEALRRATGLGFPWPGEALEQDGVRLLWAGRDQALLIGAAPDPALRPYASVTDQSDGWAAMELGGAGAADALARLTPLDLRPGAFAPGRTARSLLGHMSAQITARDDGFEILVMRSMAATAAHEIEQAMRSLAARG